jgi:glycopeptide antibiotics resistance protein
VEKESIIPIIFVAIGVYFAQLLFDGLSTIIAAAIFCGVGGAIGALVNSLISKLNK